VVNSGGNFPGLSLGFGEIDHDRPLRLESRLVMV
jgi:hypothetical protein